MHYICFFMVNESNIFNYNNINDNFIYSFIMRNFAGLFILTHFCVKYG